VNNLRVNCYSGHTYAERPLSFRWDDKEYQVEEIERAWVEPGKRCFQMRTGDNKTFKLCYNEITTEWSILGLADEG
jgi:hypothetical protein